MEHLIKSDDDYKKWIESVSSRYMQSQVKAAVSVNRELLSFYWSLGRDIVDMKAESKWGTGFYKELSADLKRVLPNVKGFATSNLRYMRRFYLLYADSICPQPVGRLGDTIITQNHTENEEKLEYAVTNENYPQAVGKITMDEILTVPWGHHRSIMDKCKGDTSKAQFYVRKIIKNNWSRTVLENFLETDLYERQGKAISNFEYSLPAVQSDLAQEITKDPYNFDFLTIQEDYDEKQLKDALMDNVTKLLLELGQGFALVGREYPLPIEGTEERIDLLFYHLHLRCYVVVEVKVRAFDSRDIGQTGTYIAIADDLIKEEHDNRTIGLIICKSKNNVLAQYAVRSSSEPISVSSYELSNFLPTAEEIEEKLTC